jgi:serine/threonine-protein kinase RsbT
VVSDVRVAIGHEADIVTARQKGRELAAAIGFSGIDLTLIALAISEIARNIVSYAVRGEILFAAVDDGARRGIMIIGRDDGPGIPDIQLAMRDGYSTANSLGVGLPGAKRVMDDFEIASKVGNGTTVTMRKWLRRARSLRAVDPQATRP